MRHAVLMLLLACCAAVLAAMLRAKDAELEKLLDCRAAVPAAGFDERALMAIARLEQETDMLRVRVEELEDAVAKEK